MRDKRYNESQINKTKNRKFNIQPKITDYSEPTEEYKMS